MTEYWPNLKTEVLQQEGVFPEFCPPATYLNFQLPPAHGTTMRTFLLLSGHGRRPGRSTVLRPLSGR
jgi:hypothetical protein